MARTILTLDEQIARDEKKLQEKKARAARIKASKGNGPTKRLAKAARIMRALEKELSGETATLCGGIAWRIDGLIQRLDGQQDLPLEAVASQDE